MKEPEGYRIQLSRLSERFPNREALTIVECAALVGCHRTTLTDDPTFPSIKIRGAYRIPIVQFAKWLCGGTTKRSA